MESVGTFALWASFFSIVIVVFSIDLFLLGGRKTHIVSTREAFSWTLVWVCCALTFNVGLWFYLYQTTNPTLAYQKSLEFLTGYLIEESLSVDNMFVFLMIFSYFRIPREYQRRVLMYGVLGAIIMRFIVIVSGTWLVSRFHWILYLFGAFLVFTGIKMLWLAQRTENLGENPFVIWIEKHIRMTRELSGESFFVKKNARRYATPLFLALVLVEISDLVFAFDSIPAIFAITTDPFIVFTSNIFAVLGLRSLYFLLANLAEQFYLLKYGVALVLIFVGCKMLFSFWIKIPILLALSIIATILLTSVVFSLLKRPRKLGTLHGNRK